MLHSGYEGSKYCRKKKLRFCIFSAMIATYLHTYHETPVLKEIVIKFYCLNIIKTYTCKTIICFEKNPLHLWHKTDNTDL